MLVRYARRIVTTLTRILVRRERAASTLLHPAAPRITATLCQGPPTPEAVRLREQSRAARDVALEELL